jgi:phospholipid-translocating ATPase/phospholipid-transporting ATPase
MFLGTYTSLFESAISPWTTLGPLAFVISVSLLVEGDADYKRHKNDAETNNADCVVLKRAEELEADPTSKRDDTIMKGKNVVVNINQA